MTKNKWLLLGSSIVLFLGLVVLAIYYESTGFLYAASALPILIVLLLPDIKQYQYIRTSDNNQVRFSKHGEGEESTLSIAFAPGYVKWKRRTLYFHLTSISDPGTTDGASSSSDNNAASLSVLPFDLRIHPRKQGWVGVDLSQLAERTRGLSYTTDEVTRLVIRMDDLEHAAMQTIRVTNNAAASAPGKNTMEA